MVRVALIAVAIASVACSSADVDFANGAGDTGSATETSTSQETSVLEDTAVTPEPDTGVADANCPAVHGTTTDIYVDALAPRGGTGSVECPLQKLGDAAALPLTTSTTRTVHVQAGTYNEAGAITVRPRETYLGEGGLPKVVVPSSAPICRGIGSCAFNLDPGSLLDTIMIDGGGVAHGIVVAGTATPVARIRNVTVRKMIRDGIVVTAGGLTLGPNAHSNENGGDGLQGRLGSIFINEGPNGFDNNIGAGIHMGAGSLFVDNVATASSNAVGVLFDRMGYSSAAQVLSQIDILNNRTHGVVIGSGWTNVQIRKAVINRNARVGVWMEYNAGGTNAFDLGSTGPGGNVFGSPSAQNGNAGIFICGSGAAGSFVANGNNWTNCAPTQARTVNCETWPLTYKDVAYVPRSTVSDTTPDPLAAPTSCTAM